MTEFSQSASAPDAAPFADLLPDSHTTEQFQKLLDAAARRLHGAPSDEEHKKVLTEFMGSEHSTKAEDYAAAVAKFLGVRGSLWSLEALQEQLADKVDRRIVPIDALDEAPKAKEAKPEGTAGEGEEPSDSDDEGGE